MSSGIQLEQKVSSDLGEELPGSFEFNKTIFRFGRKKSCWAIGGSDVDVQGNPYEYCCYGSWRDSSRFLWSSKKLDYKSYGQGLSQVKAGLDKRRDKKFNSLEFYIKDLINGPSVKKRDNERFPYFDKELFGESVKGVTFIDREVKLAKYDEEKEKVSEEIEKKWCGAIVKIRNNKGDTQGAQFISWNGEVKKFILGSKIGGNYSCLGGEPQSSDYIFITEGFRDAAVIDKAVRSISHIHSHCVLFALSASNIKAVYNAVKPFKKNVVICGDNDTAGLRVREEVGTQEGLLYKYPQTEGADWHDVYSSSGIEIVKRGIMVKPGDFLRIIPLGTLGNDFYYFSSYFRGILKCNLAHNKDQLFTLAPSDYWYEKFPKVDPVTGETKGINFEKCARHLKEKCVMSGQYSPEKVRGAGFYLSDEPETPVYGFSNMETVGPPKEGLIHVSRKEIYIPKLTNKTDRPKEGVNDLRELMSKMCWDREEQSDLLLGWLLAAPFCGALEWRPHVWLTADSSSGKSWIQSNICLPMILSSSHRITGQSSEAGIRSMLQTDSLPVIIDETEVEKKEDVNKVKAIVGLLRQSSSGNDARIVKGTSDGGYRTYATSTMALLSSVRTCLDFEADKNRFIVIQLNKLNQSSQTFLDIKKGLRKMKLKDIAREHCDYMFNNFDLFQDAYDELVVSNRDSGLNAHQARSYAVIQAALSLYDIALSKSIIAELADREQEASLSEADQVFNHIMLRTVEHNGSKYDISFLVRSALGKEPISEGGRAHNKELLTRFGILVDEKTEVMYLFSTHPRFVRHVMGDYPASNWKDILVRSGRVTEEKRKRLAMSGFRGKAILIKDPLTFYGRDD